MDGGTEGAWRRLNAALFKLEQFISSIDRISGSNFPHGDSEVALRKIRKHFEMKRAEIRSIPRTDETAVDDLQELLREARDEVRDYTKWLGIILRSTNLRNSFEVYHPLKRLAQKAVSKRTRLIFSSEWEFVPFTYPMNVAALPNFIIVGTPATESQNILVIPLAGHEIGHSVWQTINGRTRVKPEFERRCKTFVTKNKKLFKPPLYKQRDVLITPRILTHLLDKAEEVFCDLVGLHMFGASYFYAFEYFLAPGVNRSSGKYPPSLQRVRFLEEYAKRAKIDFQRDVIESWNQEEEPEPNGPMPYELADLILAECISDLMHLCQTSLDKKGVTSPDTRAVTEIEKAFRRGEPYGTKAKLSEVINALWLVAQDKDLSRKNDRDALTVDIEVALKSIEVSEYYSRLEE